MADDKQLKFRFRLHFDDSITFGEDEEEKRKCWFLCHRKSTISDLASSILKDFDLKTQCPDGITLCLEQFALISSQTIDILRETDIVTVKKKVSKKRARTSGPQPEIVKKAKIATKNESSDNDDSSEESDEEESEEESSEEDEPPAKKIQQNTTPARPTPIPKPPAKQATAPKPAVPTNATQKNTSATPKPTSLPAKQTTPAPKPAITKPANPVTKKFSSDSDSDSSDSSEDEQSTPKSNGTKSQAAPKQAQKPPMKPTATPTKQTTLPKGHIKFDEQDAQPKKNTENNKPITPNKQNNKNQKTAIQQQDRLENVSVILHRGHNNNNFQQKPTKLKPVRDYNAFPLLQQTDAPQRGDLLAFNVLDLCAWNPEVVRKEGVVEHYNTQEDTITIRIDPAFKVSKKLNVPQSLMKAQSKENRYSMYNDWDNAEDEEEEEESETEEVVTVPRGDLSDVRIIERKGK